MGHPRPALVGLALFLGLPACGGGGGAPPPGADGGGRDARLPDGGAADGGDLGCDPADHCGAAGFVCGVHQVSSCGEVDCGPCRFGADLLGEGDVVTAPDGLVHLAWLDPSGAGLLHAVGGAGALVPETIDADASGEGPSLDVGPDGAVHVAWVGEAAVMHAVRAAGAGAWEVREVGPGSAVRVAVDGTGAVHLVVAGQDPSTRAPTLDHVVWNGSAYDATPIDGPPPVQDPAVGGGPDGAVSLVYRSGIQEIAVFDLVGGAFVRDATVPAPPDQPAGLSVAVGEAGALDVLALLGNYTLRTGSQLVTLSRAGGAWTQMVRVDTGRRVTTEVALAGGPGGTRHMVFHGARPDGLFLSRPGSTREVNLDPQSGCDEGRVRLAVDSGDQPWVLRTSDCTGTVLLRPIERRSDAYVQACDAAAAAICAEACVCGSPDCCFGGGAGGGSSCLFGPGDTARALCVDEAWRDLCGDLTAEPAPLIDCAALLASDAPACLDGHYVVPGDCWAIIAASH